MTEDGDKVMVRALKGRDGGQRFRVRVAEREDARDIMQMIRELAEFEREPEAVHINEEMLLRDGWPGGEDSGDGEAAATPLFTAAMAQLEDDNGTWRSVGYALWFMSYSTWDGRTLWLEDLYVRPEARGGGLGKALIEYCARQAKRQRCERFQWYVLEWNKPSIDFYRSLGARLLPEWRFVRMDRGEVDALLASIDKSLAIT